MRVLTSLFKLGISKSGNIASRQQVAVFKWRSREGTDRRRPANHVAPSSRCSTRLTTNAHDELQSPYRSLSLYRRLQTVVHAISLLRCPLCRLPPSATTRQAISIHAATHPHQQYGPHNLGHYVGLGLLPNA